MQNECPVIRFSTTKKEIEFSFSFKVVRYVHMQLSELFLTLSLLCFQPLRVTILWLIVIRLSRAFTRRTQSSTTLLARISHV